MYSCLDYVFWVLNALHGETLESVEAILKLTADTLVYRVVSRLIVVWTLDVFDCILVNELLVTNYILPFFLIFDSLGCVAVWIFIVLYEVSIFFVFLWSYNLSG